MAHLQIRGLNHVVCIHIGGVGNLPPGIRRLYGKRLITDFELIERNRRQAEAFRAVIAPQNHAFRAARFSVEFLNGKMLLLAELIFQLLRVGTVEIDQGGFVFVAIHLSQTAAGRLQNHISGAVSLLRENNARQTAAVPPLFPDLHQ